MWRVECRSLGWLRLRLGLGLAKRDTTDWLVQLVVEILLNCRVETGRSYELQMSWWLSLRPEG